MKKHYSILLSWHEWVSFLAGIIVTGYVVEISLNPAINYWHLGTIFCGIVFGFLSYVLLRVYKHFNDQVLYYKSNNTAIPKEKAETDSWSYINNTEPKQVFGRLAKFWMPLIILLMPLTLIIGFILFFIGNKSVLAEEKISKNREKIELIQSIQSIDSLNNIRNKLYIQEMSLLQDSIIKEKEINVNNKKIIDSLYSKLKAIKPKKKIVTPN